MRLWWSQSVVDHVVRRECPACLGYQRIARLLVDHSQHAGPSTVL
jgi:hypothetical protein